MNRSRTAKTTLIVCLMATALGCGNDSPTDQGEAVRDLFISNSFKLDSSPFDVQFSGDAFFVVPGRHVDMYSLEDPINPEFVSHRSLPTDVSLVCAYPPRALLTSQDGSYCVNFSQLPATIPWEGPPLDSEWDIFCPPYLIGMDNRRLWVTEWLMCTDPVLSFDTTVVVDGPWTSACDGTNVYFGVTGRAFLLLSLNNGTHPAVTQTGVISGWPEHCSPARKSFVMGDYVFCPANIYNPSAREVFLVIDLTNKEEPKVVKTVTLHRCVSIKRAGLDGHILAFAADGTENCIGLVVYDVSQPSSPQLIAQRFGETPAECSYCYGDQLDVYRHRFYVLNRADSVINIVNIAAD